VNEIQIQDVPVTSAAFAQLGILTLDGSGSMLDPVEPSQPGAAEQTKAEEVNIAVRELLTRFHGSRKAPNFYFALTTFHDRVTFEGPWTALVDIDDNGNYDPTANGTGGTLIASGLEAAERIADDFLANAPAGLPASVVILTMSDGECFEPARTIAVADRLKADSRKTIAAAFFATKGESGGSGPALLKKICSDPTMHYKTVYDAETLRKFFEASLTAAAAGAGAPSDPMR
jgi:hypothetical protein